MLGVVTSRMAAAAFLVGSSTGGSSDMPITSRSLACGPRLGAEGGHRRKRAGGAEEMAARK